MRVLHVADTPLSNAPSNLVCCQRDAGMDAELLLQRKANRNRVFVGGQLYTELQLPVLEERFLKADVLHFHNYAPTLQIFKDHPHLWEIARTKPRCIQYHSPRDATEDFEATLADTSLRQLVIAQYHPRQYPECEVIPNVLPIGEKMYSPLPGKWSSPGPAVVSYAPSNTNLRGWNDKGWDFTQPVLQRLARRGVIVTEVMTQIPYEECMMRKRWAHVGIDEVATGSYHLSGLEYLSMGCVTIGRLDELTKQALLSVVTGNPEEARVLPWVEADASTLEAALTRLVADRDALRAQAEAGRRWMERHWNPREHMKRFQRIYETL